MCVVNLRKDHSCDHAVKVMIGWRTEAKTVLSRLLCLSAQQSCILTNVVLHLATSFTHIYECMKTFSNRCLGSHVDEGCSEVQ